MRPEFWRDELMADLPVPTRLTYIGLWCVADDAGYLEWRPRQIGAEIYPLTSPAKRDRQVKADLDRLVEAGRISLLSCGVHAVIPTLEKHRIAGGNRSERVMRDHMKEPYGQVRTRTDMSGPSGVRTSTEKSRSESVSLSESVSPSPSPRDGANGSDEPRRRGATGMTPIGDLLPVAAKGGR